MSIGSNQARKDLKNKEPVEEPGGKIGKIFGKV